jgi:hypothetical protein
VLFEYVFYFELAFHLIELLAKRPSVDEISAKLEVLESEHESLKQSLKESHERETKTKKELEEKHPQAMAEVAEKLKISNNRIKTLAAKIKAVEAEAANVDEPIFCKDFAFPACILYSSLPNPESDRMILCVYQRVWDLSGSRIPESLGLEPMKKPEILLTTSLNLAGPLLRSYP